MNSDAKKLNKASINLVLICSTTIYYHDCNEHTLTSCLHLPRFFLSFSDNFNAKRKERRFLEEEEPSLENMNIHIKSLVLYCGLGLLTKSGLKLVLETSSTD